MLAVSSFRPFQSCAPEIVRNQIAAKESWDGIFDRIIYLNDPEPSLASMKTQFIPSPDPPKISDLASQCARWETWSCLINSDIWLDPRVTSLPCHFQNRRVTCAISRRWQFNPGSELDKNGARLIDLGLDFFIAQPHVWKRIAEEIPTEFLIGHILYDTWIMAFMSRNFRYSFYDLTWQKLVYHPIHGNRGDQSMTHQVGRDYIDRIQWPMNKL